LCDGEVELVLMPFVSDEGQQNQNKIIEQLCFL